MRIKKNKRIIKNKSNKRPQSFKIKEEVKKRNIDIHEIKNEDFDFDFFGNPPERKHKPIRYIKSMKLKGADSAKNKCGHDITVGDLLVPYPN